MAKISDSATIAVERVISLVPPASDPEAKVNEQPHPLRRDGDLLLTGRAEFVDDIVPRGLLHASILRSPHPHALINYIDTTLAKGAPGVRAVLTGLQAEALVGPMPFFFDPTLVGCRTFEFRCLAIDRVRWVGQPVVAVVAETLAQAEAARPLIRVSYDVLPHVLEVEDALEEGAPRIFETWPDNILGSFPFSEGDAEQRLATAPHVISGDLHVGRHQCAPMETRGYVASWDRGGRLTLWASTQNPHPLRTNLSTMLNIPEERIRVVATRMGGGFGHKFNGYAEEPLVCALSKIVEAPVKWIETREESLLVGARDFTHRFKVGFDGNGKVLAITDRILGNIGALETWGGWTMVFPAGMTFPGPYRVLDYDIQSLAVVTHKAPWNGYRGYGKEQAAMVLERIMDLIAEDRRIDPAEVRKRNFIPPEEFPYWTAAKHLDSGNYADALAKVLDLGNYEGQRKFQCRARESGRCLGIGIGFELTPEGGDFAGSFVRGFDTSTVRVHPTGAVTVLTGVTSPGTGNETSIAALVAREFGISPDTIQVVQGDTDACPYGFGNFSSRSIATGGAAAVLAARELRDRMSEAAAVLMECDVSDLEFAQSEVRRTSDRAVSLSFRVLADTIFRKALAVPGLTQPLLEATKVDHPHNFHHAPDSKGRYSTYPSYPYSAHLATIELDVETGIVHVIDYAAVDDCGVIISPKFVAGQLYGAIAQGIGGALWEHQPYENLGSPLVQSFKHYLTPRATDLPKLKLRHQHTPSPFTLLGTKGVGESGVGGAMAAILNAVNDALSPSHVRIHQIPLSPPTILQALAEGSRR